MKIRITLLIVVALFADTIHAQHANKGDTADDPYNLLPPPGSTRDTAGEPFAASLDLKLAGEYLDLRRHNVQRSCYACHSAGAFTAARAWLDPLAPTMMEQRAYMERKAKDFTSKQHLDNKAKSVERAGQLLVALGMAQHDALSTGTLQPSTHQALDFVWDYLREDGGWFWVPFKEAPSAIDHFWGNMLLAQAAATAPGNYMETATAKAGLVKLRQWFTSPENAPKDLHERGMRLLAHAYIGGIVSDEQKTEHINAFFAQQQPTHGWSTATLSVHPDWKRPDGQPLDATRSDSYATAFAVLVLAKAGVSTDDPRLANAVDWLKRSQRQTGGWFTMSPRKKDILASYQATSSAIQALAAVGVIPPPKKISQTDFDVALSAADKLIPEEVIAPSSTGPQTPKGSMAAMSEPTSNEPMPPTPRPVASSPAQVNKLKQQALAAIGGAEKALQRFEFTETITPINGATASKQRRFEPNTDNGYSIEDRDSAIVAAWALNLLTDPRSQFGSLPAITLDGEQHAGLKITGSIAPAVHLHFDPKTNLLSRIGYAGHLHFPTAYITTDGVTHPTQLRITNTKNEPVRSLTIGNIKRLSDGDSNSHIPASSSESR